MVMDKLSRKKKIYLEQNQHLNLIFNPYVNEADEIIHCFLD